MRGENQLNRGVKNCNSPYPLQFFPFQTLLQLFLSLAHPATLFSYRHISGIPIFLSVAPIQPLGFPEHYAEYSSSGRLRPAAVTLWCSQYSQADDPYTSVRCSRLHVSCFLTGCHLWGLLIVITFLLPRFALCHANTFHPVPLAGTGHR
jgi:hypothetical protein